MRTSSALTRLIFHVALTVALAAPVMAAGGYVPDYDFPNQGDDWYGRGLPDSRRDYPATALDQFSDGDDYGAGYDPFLERPGQGPPLERTSRQQFEYKFRFSSIIACLANTECSDGLFCNGVEQCTADVCAAGAPPTCDDGDVCTTDSCSDAIANCVFQPVPPPDEVDGLTVDLTDPLMEIATLSWDVVLGAVSYNVYRGEDPALSDLSCLFGDVPGTSVDDDGTSGASGLHLFLVSAEACGESILGRDSDGAPRFNPAPCP